MTNKPRSRGKRALTPFCVLLMGGGALAQQAVIDHCRQTSSDADRIACLEAALLGKAMSTAPLAAPAATPEEAVIQESAADEATAVEVVTAAPVAAAPVTAEPAGIGAEQVIARNETAESIQQKLERASGMIVARYDTVPFEKLQVTLENGQIWRQIKGDTQRLRVSLKRNQTVDIEESTLSGYKMHLNEMGRMLRVERVQ